MSPNGTRRTQSGQALVGALVTLVLLFTMAGGLVLAVSSLLDHRINTGNLFVADFGTQTPINAGAAYVAGHGLLTGPSLCPNSQSLPGLGSGGEVSGVWCRQIDYIVPGTPSVGRPAFSGGCSVTPLSGAGGRHVLVWLSAVGAASAYVDGSASGCSGGADLCSASGSGRPAQLALDCDLGSLATPYLHISGSGQAAGSFRFAQYAGPFVAAPGSPVPVGASPRGIVTADLNRDGIPDLVLPDWSSDSVSVLLGVGGARFAAATTLPAGGPDPVAVAVADVNGDGSPDLVVLTVDDQQVHVLLGNGDGTFQPAQAAGSTPSNPVAMVAGDFNGDGRTDLAVLGGSNQVAILLGNGDGTFSPAPGSPLQANGTQHGLVAADFNRDGKLDLAVTETGPNRVQIFAGHGDGSFSSGVQVGVGSNPVPMVAADLNGDGRVDLVTGNTGDGTLSVLLGRGDGTFVSAPGSPVPAGGTPASIAVGDFAGDGRLDLAVTNSPGSTLTVLYGAGDGSFSYRPPLKLATGTNPAWVVATDLDRDGVLDLAVANSGSNNVTVYRGNRAQASVFMLGAAAPSGASVQLEEGDVVVSADGRTTALSFEGAV